MVLASAAIKKEGKQQSKFSYKNNTKNDSENYFRTSFSFLTFFAAVEMRNLLSFK